MTDTKDNEGSKPDHNSVRDQALKAVVIDRVEGKLTPNTIKQIYNAIIAYSKNGYESIWNDNKKERRAAVDDKRYVELSARLLNNIEELIERSKEEVLQDLKIDLDDFESNIHYQLGKELGERLRYQTNILTNLKKSLSNKKIIDDETLKKIIKAQIDYIRNNMDSLKNLEKYTKDRNLHERTIALKLHDYISKEFGYEDEDIEATFEAKFNNKDSNVQKNLEIDEMMMMLKHAKVEALPEAEGRDVSGDAAERLNAYEKDEDEIGEKE